MEYTVVEAAELRQSIIQVNERLKHGWRLQGGIAVHTLRYPYHQAMVRESKTRNTEDEKAR